MVLAEEVGPRGVAQQVVHPAHVPLHAKAQTAHINRAGHTGPAGRLLGHHVYTGERRTHCGVERTHEGGGIKVLVATVGVGHPLAGFPRKVEVEHGGHGVHPQAIEVVLLQPEDRVADEEVAHLVAAVVEHQALPLRLEATPRVGVFVQRCAVKGGQTVGVGRKVGRHPVQQHPNAMLVQGVHQVHQVLRRTVTRRGREVTGDLVAPGAIKRVFCHRHQLDMGEVQRLAMRSQALGQFAVVQERAVVRALPRAQVHFVDGDGLRTRLAGRTFFHPLGVVPGVVERPDAGRGAGRAFAAQGEGVGLVKELAVSRFDAVFVAVTGLGTGHKPGPAARSVMGGRQGCGLPAVEVPHHRHRACVGCPNPEIHTPLPRLLREMGAKFVKLPVVRGKRAGH